MAATGEATGINATEEKMGKLREGERGVGSIAGGDGGGELNLK